MSVCKKYIVIFVCLCFPVLVLAQAGSSAFSFMRLPMSARLNSLGGSNVSMKDGDISLALSNPAMLDSATHEVLQLNYAYFMQGINIASALYQHNYGDNYFAAGLHYVDYGKIERANEYGYRNGSMFTAKDIVMNLMYARQLGPYFTIGVNLKPIYSVYEHYFAFSLGADVGGHFQTADRSLQVGLTLQNIGWQLKTFHSDENGEKRGKLPLNLQLGLNYRLRHAPFRVGLTIHDMQHWNLNYQLTNQAYAYGQADAGKIAWYDMMFRHTIFFVDIVPKSDRFYLTVSYNHQRRQEMNLKDQRSFAGFALGAGLRIKQFRLSIAFSQFSKGQYVYQVGLTTDIKQLMR